MTEIWGRHTFDVLYLWILFDTTHSRVTEILCGTSLPKFRQGVHSTMELEHLVVLEESSQGSVRSLVSRQNPFYVIK